MSRQLGYCTNVHAGADLRQTRTNLEKFALVVKQRFSPDDSMGIGLWLSASTSRQLQSSGKTSELAEWLDDHGLVPFTFNGFPYGDFHRDVVKHDVYQPTWFEAERFDYTVDLIDILHAVLPPQLEGSISTLPISWGNPRPSSDQLDAAAAQLCRIAEYLRKLEEQQGRLIYICLEPEPGCVLQRTGDVIDFCRQRLLPAGDDDLVHRYIRACHDICHAAVMFEEQDEVLRQYRDAGILVGKVQVSNAVRVSLDSMSEEERAAAIEQLYEFAEDRYLHQTVISSSSGQSVEFFEDLPAALASVPDAARKTEEWRIHFHVPIYLEQFGNLSTTQDQIRDCLKSASDQDKLVQFEVETYAWDVLPAELQHENVAIGIAEEMRWLAQVFTE